MTGRVTLRTPAWTAYQVVLAIVVVSRGATAGRGVWPALLTLVLVGCFAANVRRLTAVTPTHVEVRTLRGWRRAPWRDVLVLERRWGVVRAVLRDGSTLPLYGVRWRGGRRSGDLDVTTARGLAAWARRCVGVPSLTPG